MHAGRTLILRVRAAALRVIDRVLAVALTVGAVLDAAAQPDLELGILAVCSLLALTGSVALRSRRPVLAAVVAVTGFAVFELASDYKGDGAFEVAAVALNFYSVGRHCRDGTSTLLLVALFGYLLAGVAVVSGVSTAGSIGSVFGPWALFGCLPFAFGRTLATRAVLTGQLKQTMRRLGEEQDGRARSAAAHERGRVARELHDVIAHCVSVMVVQTAGARRVAASDEAMAGEALRVTETAGREALVELRRIVGVLRRDEDELGDSAAPGLSQLPALVKRSRAAGLAVELRVSGELGTLSTGLDLVAYRLVQEALTNTIKHAGATGAQVSVTIATDELQLLVTDDGHDTAPEHAAGGSGHGLVGMEERVRLYGGELRARPRASGGFEVSARIPLAGLAPAAQTLSAPPCGSETVIGGKRERGVRPHWLDRSLAAVPLVVIEISVLTAPDRRGPLAVSLFVGAGIALAARWRRRAPLVFLAVLGALAVVMNTYLIPLRGAPLIAAYFLLVPMYTVAAWADRARAVLGLAIFLGGAAISELSMPGGRVGDLAGGAFTMTAAWTAGRAIRARRLLNAQLEQTSARLAAEREDRARLVVAGERSRIARELHAVIARSVAGMVVQAEGARTLLGRDKVQADTAMSAIENTGREVLGEMRRILGVLRHPEESSWLAPQPGVDQIYALIQGARERGQSVQLSVEGEPGTLPTGLNLGLYRILEDALRSAAQHHASVIAVSLRFGPQELELALTARCPGANGWPTVAMRERLALCGGRLNPDLFDQDGWRFGARIPRGLQGPLAGEIPERAAWTLGAGQPTTSCGG